jgi:hypothetical protein
METEFTAGIEITAGDSALSWAIRTIIAVPRTALFHRSLSKPELKGSHAAPAATPHGCITGYLLLLREVIFRASQDEYL